MSLPPAAGPEEVDVEDLLDWEARPDSVPFWRHAVAGSCAGIAEHVLMYPLDTAKTHMQALRAAEGVPQAGLVTVLRNVVRERGVRGLFRGASVISTGCVPAHVGMFSVYELAKARTLNDAGGHQPLRVAACGCAGAAVHDLVLTPMDLVKQRLQLGAYRGPLHCVQSVVQREGFLALYRAFPVTLIANAPYTGTLVAVNETLKRVLGLGRGGTAELPWYFLTGGLGGAVAAFTTLPLDVVKTRLQTQTVTASDLAAAAAAVEARGGGFASTARTAAAVASSAGSRAALSDLRYHGVLDTIGLIKREGGLPVFFRGCVPRVLLAAPSGAVCWGTYDVIQNVLTSMGSC